MIAQISKITKQASLKTGGTSYMVCFKCEDGHSRTSWIDSGYRNYIRWSNLLVEGITLDGLNVTKDGKYIDADSFPERVKEERL